MPATGIEPVREYKSRRILSPVRLPVPPLRHTTWLRATLPGGRPPSTIAAKELNFCVRYGNRWTLIVINTNYFIYMISHSRVFIPLVTRRGIEPLFSA